MINKYILFNGYSDENREFHFNGDLCKENYWKTQFLT